MKYSRWLQEVIRSIRFRERTDSLKTWPQRALFATWILAIAGSPLRAQVVPDGATTTLANVTNIITGTMTVGTNSPFTLLRQLFR